MYDFADLFLVSVLSLVLGALAGRVGHRYLRDRIAAQNEEITRLSHIVDGYRTRYQKEYKAEQQSMDLSAWPTELTEL